MPHTCGQHHGLARNLPEMPHKVSPLTTTCLSGASGKKLHLPLPASLACASCANACVAPSAGKAKARTRAIVLNFFMYIVRCLVRRGAIVVILLCSMYICCLNRKAFCAGSCLYPQTRIFIHEDCFCA